jgi:chromosome segregation ATPase
VDLIFMGLSLGCVVFVGKIVMDYLNEVPVWEEKIAAADIEMAQYEAEIADLAKQKESASAQGNVIDEEINNMASMAIELKAEIDQIKKENARTGKVVLRREPDSGPA